MAGEEQPSRRRVASTGPTPPGPTPPSSATRTAAPATPTRPARTTGAARAEGEEPKKVTYADIVAGFEPREGDTLVVSYGAVKLQLGNMKFGSVEVGNSIYTRKLREGDNPVEQFERVYDYLRRTSEVAAKEKIRTWFETVESLNKNGAAGV
jgi:hypothetical protein